MAEVGSTFLTYHLPEGGEVTVPYLNQHLNVDAQILYDLITGSRGQVTHMVQDSSIEGNTSDWQVITTVSAGELNTDLYFRWGADLANQNGDIVVDLGWRLFGSDTVVPIRNNISTAQRLAFQRILHSQQDNQGIIEIVANNTSTEVRTQEEQFATDWNVRYRWEWTETVTGERTVRVPYRVRVQTGTRTERQPYTERVCRQVQEQEEYFVTVGTNRYLATATFLYTSPGCQSFFRSASGSADNAADAQRAARNNAPSTISRRCSNIVPFNRDFTRDSLSNQTVRQTQSARRERRTRTVERTVCHDETRYRDVQVPVYRTVTRYREETRTQPETVNRRTSWSVIRSGTFYGATEAASIAGARAAAAAVQVTTNGRPNSRARARIERNISNTRNTQTETVQAAGTAVFSNISVESRIIIGEAIDPDYTPTIPDTTRPPPTDPDTPTPPAPVVPVPQNLRGRRTQATVAGVPNTAVVRISWDAVEGATAYNIRWRSVGDDVWNNFNIPDTTIDLVFNAPNMEWSVNAVIDGVAGDWVDGNVVP